MGQQNRKNRGLPDDALRMAVRLTEQAFRLLGKKAGRDDVVEHTDGSGVSFVVVVLLELVFGDAFGDRGVYEACRCRRKCRTWLMRLPRVWKKTRSLV